MSTNLAYIHSPFCQADTHLYPKELIRANESKQKLVAQTLDAPIPESKIKVCIVSYGCLRRVYIFPPAHAPLHDTHSASLRGTPSDPLTLPMAPLRGDPSQHWWGSS